MSRLEILEYCYGLALVILVLGALALNPALFDNLRPFGEDGGSVSAVVAA